MKVYTQLNLEEREKIFKLRQNGVGINSIAQVINRDKSTISRELKRNRYTDSIVYLPDKANNMAKERKYILKPFHKKKRLSLRKRDFKETLFFGFSL